MNKKPTTPKFRVVGIMEPGIINVFIRGRFSDVHLHTADDATLEILYKEGCPFIQMTPEGVLNEIPDAKNIVVAPIKKQNPRRK